MIVVTTPTGQIGRQVLAALLPGDEPVRVVVRDPARLPEEARERAEVVVGSHGDRDVVERAFDGADAVFWLVPPNLTAPDVDARYLGFSAAAREAFVPSGVRHVVGVSALGRGTAVADRAGYVTATLALDDAIAATGVAYRALALPSFMDNVLRQAVPIATEGVYSGPLAGDLKAPTCATGDIAAVAAGLLRERTWTGADEVPVLGPEDLSAEDQAGIMTEVLGRPVRYERTSFESAGAALRRSGASEAMVQGLVDMVRAKQDGLDHGVRRTAATSSPTTFRQWCQEVLRPAVLAAAPSREGAR